MPSITVMAPTIRLALATEKPDDAMQKLGHPGRDAAHGKGQRRQTEGGRQKGRVAEEPQERVARSAVGCIWSLAPRSGSQPRSHTAPR